MQPVINIDLLVEQAVLNLNSHIDSSRGQIQLGEYVKKGVSFSDRLDGRHVFANRDYQLLIRTHNDKVINVGKISYYSYYDGEGAQGKLTLDLRHQLKLKDGRTIPRCRIELELSTEGGGQGSHYVHPDFHRNDSLYMGRWRHPIQPYAPADLSSSVPTSLFQGARIKRRVA